MGCGTGTHPDVVPAFGVPSGRHWGRQHSQQTHLHLSMPWVCQGCCHLNSRSGLFPIKERCRQQHLQQAQPEGHVFSAAAEMRSLQEASCIICRGEPTGSKCLL